jgi:hypothetical protein
VKLLFTFLIFIFCNKIFAQKAVAYNQTYTYKKSDGFLSENYGYMSQTNNGKIYGSGYTSNIMNIVGNNYSKQISFAGILSMGSLHEIDSSTIFFLTSANIYIVKGDTISKTIPFVNSAFITKIAANNYILSNETATNNLIYRFDGNKLEYITAIKEVRIGKSFYYHHYNDTLYMKSDSLEIKLNLTTKYIEKTIPKNIGLEFVTGNIIYKYKKNPQLFQLKEGELKEINSNIFNPYSQQNEKLNLINSYSNHYLQKSTSTEFTILDKEALQPTAFFYSTDIVGNPNKISNSSYLIAAGNMPLRVFDYIKKYPKIYNNVDASNIFCVVQNTNGGIWAGSYKTQLTIINGNKQKEVLIKDIQFMNGGSSYNNKMYLVGEYPKNGLLVVNENGSYKKLTTNVTGFYTLISKNKKDFYFASADYKGLFRKKIEDVDNVNIPWQIIDSNKNLKLNNILSVVEDTLGRIWCSHPNRGIAVYEPNKNVANTFLIKQKESAFGFMSSITDYKGTVWFGCTKAKGLYCYSDYTKPAIPASCEQIIHPLLQTKNYISALTIYKHWLVMAAYDKILLLDLDAYHNKNKTVIKYLTSQETNFTAPTEQNSMLTSFTDSTIWFSTSDMLYQLDLKRWLALPKYKVTNNVYLKANDKQIRLDTSNTIYVEPTFTTFDINMEYQSPDGLPRYTSAMLIKDGDTIKLPEPNLQSDFSIKNLSSGSYTFIEEIYEQDGTTSHYQYKIIIKKFLWQQWWFWLGIALLCIGILAYLLNLKKKKQLAEQAAKTTKAELQTVKAEQAKKIANLQLVTLSSQFRPHFILNALNTIGAQMDDKPEAESVLSRLGESINLIFSHAQQQKIVHPFANEWQLVENIIHIHRLMYLKQLQTDLPNNDVLKKYSNIKVPLGILQIPIENALLHGLSNKENGSWILAITIEENNDFIFIKITDNGVGRKKSATLSNFTKHGTGTKNLTEIISIINAANPHKIMMEYKDDVFAENDISYGTTVLITLPKLLDYANQ